MSAHTCLRSSSSRVSVSLSSVALYASTFCGIYLCHVARAKPPCICLRNLPPSELCTLNVHRSPSSILVPHPHTPSPKYIQRHHPTLFAAQLSLPLPRPVRHGPPTNPQLPLYQSDYLLLQSQPPPQINYPQALLQTLHHANPLPTLASPPTLTEPAAGATLTYIIDRLSTWHLRCPSVGQPTRVSEPFIAAYRGSSHSWPLGTLAASRPSRARSRNLRRRAHSHIEFRMSAEPLAPGFCAPPPRFDAGTRTSHPFLGRHPTSDLEPSLSQTPHGTLDATLKSLSLDYAWSSGPCSLRTSSL
ncbi:hypothetical protein C8Q76DRAFT_435471 [Earliella scabrosa]|nr:hypothetical protein C8Q76DRAFT_435471 [Earliella scabrosa]